MSRVPPHSPECERTLLGAMMLYGSEMIYEVVGRVEATDFYVPAHQSLFTTITAAWETGGETSPLIIHELIRGEVGAPTLGDIVGLTAEVPSRSAAVACIEVVTKQSHKRRLIGVLSDASEKAWKLDSDSDQLAESVTQAIADAERSSTDLPDDADSLDSWLATERPVMPWIVPGLVRAKSRALVVAGEGGGKSVATRQIALCAAQGVAPFGGVRGPAVNTLLIDLENPDEAIEETGSRIVEKLRLKLGDEYRENACWLWHRPGGIDLRSRRDRNDFENLLRHVRPRLVCLGPLYRAFTKRAREDHEDAAEQVQRALDDLRVRYGFAIIIEHHAPKAQGGHRDMTPFGSSLWQRWPDLGITATKDLDYPGALRIGRYRGDRLTVSWPDRLDRGREYEMPWVGHWDKGMPAF
jgi:RecA-family ATPase